MSVPATSTFVVGNHVHGDTTKKMHSGEGVLLQYKRKRKDAQSSSEPHDSYSIKRKKPLESLLKGDKLASSRKVEEKGEAHTLHNQQEKSSSLDYMLNEETKDKHVQNVAESAKKVIPTELIQSKIISTEAKPTTFSGFQNTPIQELDLESKSFRGRPDKLSIDINVTAQPESDEVFARGYKIISDFLDKAREKYFFADDRTPSFRITEDVDECGNIIEEHELWRPLEMKDECYNNKIESTKIKIARNFKELQSEDFDISAQGNTNLKGSSSLYNELSIQCAQREAQKSLMCETPHTPKPAEEIIDLTSPEVQASTRWNHKQTCYSPWKSNNQWTTETPPLKIKKDYNMVPIIGRRLFPEEESYQQESSGSKGNPIQLMEQKSSGELKILGENSFRQERSTLVNRTDDIYNTSLSLGRPRSFHGKENVPPKRVVQPSRYRSSPYDCDERGPIMAHERKMYEAITSLADVEGSKPAIFIDKTIATYAQLGNSMKIGGRVESYVINVYCRHLFNENHPRNSHKHYFFHTASEYFLAKWKNEEARIWWRHKLITSFIGAGKAHDLSMSDKLYFPTLHEGHYFLFVVDIKGRMFFFLDSYYDENSSYHKNIKNKIISSFICTWYEAQLKPMNFNAFPAVYPKVPQQDNDTDCSIFTMKLMGWCPRNPAPIVFSPKDIPDARIRYAVDLMFSPYNALYEEKKRVKEFRL